MIRLYPVEPMGLRTADIESLSSYLLRVASAHCTTVGVLLRTLFGQEDFAAQCDVARVKHAKLETLIRPNQATASAVRVLSEAMAIDCDTLMSMTMLPLDGALVRATGFYADHIRWCSACLREQRHQRGAVYYKLIWMFQDVDVCPDHRCDLRKFCPSCSRLQASTERRHEIGSCAYCREDLAGDDPPVADASTKLGQSYEILQIVAYIAANPGTRFPKDGYARALSYLEREAYNIHSESAFQEAVGGRKRDKFTPKLRNVLHTSDVLHVSAVNLLLGEVEGTNFDLIPLDRFDRPECRRVHRKPWRDRRSVEAEAWKFFESCREGGHPSLATIARHVGLSPSGFRYLLPKFARYIVDIHLREDFMRRADLEVSLTNKIQALIHSHAKRGRVPLARKEMMKRLFKQGIWSKNSIRQEVERAFQIMESRLVDSPEICAARISVSCRSYDGGLCSCRVLCPLRMHQ